jgi:hypothetical protein
MPPVGFEPSVSAGERPQTYALERAVKGTDAKEITWAKFEWKRTKVAHAYEYWSVAGRLLCGMYM